MSGKVLLCCQRMVVVLLTPPCMYFSMSKASLYRADDVSLLELLSLYLYDAAIVCVFFSLGGGNRMSASKMNRSFQNVGCFLCCFGGVNVLVVGIKWRRCKKYALVEVVVCCK